MPENGGRAYFSERPNSNNDEQKNYFLNALSTDTRQIEYAKMLGELRAPQKDTALILRTDDIPGAQPKKLNTKTSKKARGFFP